MRFFKRDYWTKNKIIAAIFIVVAMIYFLPVCYTVCVFFITGPLKIKRQEKAMRDPAVYRPVGETLALYCQSDFSEFSEDEAYYFTLGYKWLPDELKNLHKYGRITLKTNSAHIELGGGFYHYGYAIDLDEVTSTPETNVWVLTQYREAYPKYEHTPLWTFSMDATRCLSEDELREKFNQPSEP